MIKGSDALEEVGNKQGGNTILLVPANRAVGG